MDLETTQNQSSTNGSFIDKMSPTQVNIKIAELFSLKDYKVTCKSILIVDNDISNHLFEAMEPKC